MVSNETDLPETFTRGSRTPDGNIDVATAANVRWAARLGSAAYGNPTVADGRVFVGTDDLVYLPDVAGRFHCLDAATGRLRWVQETKAETWAAPMVADGKIYLGNKRSFFVFATGPQPKLLGQVRLGSPIYSSTIVANGVVYVATQHHLWAVTSTP